MSTSTSNKRKFILAIVAMIAGFLVFAFIKQDKPSPQPDSIETLGGTSLILELKPNIDVTNKPIPITSEAIESARIILEKRLSFHTSHNTTVNVINNNQLEVQILGETDEKVNELITNFLTPAQLTLHSLHRQSELLADKVADGAVEPGYMVLPYAETDENTKEKTTKNILIKDRAALSGKYVEVAWVSPQDFTLVNIELTSEGGDKMREFTGTLTQNVDRIATVLDGEVLNYAYLAANTLGKNFVINGLDSKEEAENLVRALQNPLENEIEILEKRSISPDLVK